MKYWHILIIFIIAWAVVIIGALFKIQHWPGASILLIFGMGAQVVSLILLITKIVIDRKSNPFLNK